MSFLAGLIVGAIAMLALMLGIGAIEWETTYEVVRDDEGTILNDRIFEQQQQIFEALSQKLVKEGDVTCNTNNGLRR